MGDFDCVVIGSGMGGLAAAASLALAGKKPLVLERHNVPGGYATTFVRGRFEFDVSLHWLAGLGEEGRPSALRSMLERLDVARRLEFIPARDFYRTVAPGFDFLLPFGVSEAEGRLKGRLPEEAEGIRAIFGLMRRINAELSALDPRKGPPRPETSPTVCAYKGRTARAVVAEHVKAPDFWLVFSQMINYFGVPHAKVSFVDLAAGFMLFLESGASLIKGKSQALSQALVEVIRDNGGDLRLGFGAKRIIVKKGAVRAVVADDGTEIPCGKVICNADPKTACAKLIGLENVPVPYRRLLGAMKPAGGIFSVFLGLDASPEELGMREHSVFISDSRDMELDDHYEKILRGEDFSVLGAGIANFSATDPSYGPPGTTVLSINTVFDGASWLGFTPLEYEERKRRVADRLIDFAESLSPGLRGRIEELEIGTPRTNMSYTGNLGGSFQGFAETRLAEGSRRLPSRGPVDGLWFAGAWVNGGSFAASIGSGLAAAGQLLAERSPIASFAMRRKVKGFVGKSSAGLPDYDGAEVLRQERLLAFTHPRRLELEVTKVIEETPSTKTLRLVTRNGALPDFRPGQYLPLEVTIGGVTTVRAYGVSSARGAPWLDVTVRRKPDGFVSPYLLDEVKIGSRLAAGEPAGNFKLEPIVDGGKLVFIAGGSGITPFMSMIRTMAAEERALTNFARDVHLVYGSRREDDIIFREELLVLKKSLPWLRVDIVLSEPGPAWEGQRGFVDEAMLRSLVGDFSKKSFFFVGPAAMRDLVMASLRAAGVPARCIRTESQGLPPDPSALPGWKKTPGGATYVLTETRSGRKIAARADEPILAALERAGIALNSRCRVGECSVCRTRLVAGKAFVPDLPGRRLSDEANGYIHPCVAFPCGDLEISLP